MSLQVWLPLNGDLHNQGLNGDLEFSAINTLTFNNDGKIGKSYQRATNNTQVTTGININSNLLDLLGTEASVAVWVKPLGTHTHYNGTLLSSGNWNAKRWAFGVSQDNSKVDVLCGGYNTYIDCSVPVNQWTHLCSTFNNGISKLYKNGVYIGQLTGRANFDSDATNTCIGRETYASGYFGFNGLINDVRIYDHVLSDKEVEEIAKGLVLHYKLDNNGMGGNNLALNTKTLDIASSKNNLNMYIRGASTRQLRSDGFYESKGTASWQGLSFWANQLNLIVGTKITYSFYIYGNGSSRAFSFYPMMYNSAGTRDTLTGMPISIDGGAYTTVNAKAFTATTATTPEYHYVTFEWNQAVANIISNGGSIELSIQVHGTWNNGDWACLFAPKVEIGDTPTPWSPNPADLGIDPSIVYDCSGYENNGIITGNIQTDGNTTRYSCSMKQASGQYIRVEKRPAECMPKDAITVNLWQYATSWYNPISCTEGGGWNFENSNGIRFPVYISGVGYKVAQSTIAPASTLNAWHMLTGTMNKDNIKIYYDGQEVGTIANNSTNGIGYANNYIFIGGEAQGNSISPASSAYVGNLSDVRIYATALTPEQILELYNTSATIDNKGNVYSREYIENNKLNITKTGLFQCNKIYDDDELTVASIVKSTQQVQGNTIYEY